MNELERLQQENSQLKKIINDAGILTGEDAEKFEEYTNRKPTQEELDRSKEADEIFRTHDPEQIEITKLKQVVERLKEWHENNKRERRSSYDNQDFVNGYNKCSDDRDEELQSILDGVEK